MGRDKALLQLDGVPLAVRVASALWSAGADTVVAVGGDLDALGALGLAGVPDPHQGGGPLGGICVALDAAGADVVVVVACDLVDLTADAVVALVEGLGEHVAAVAQSDRLEPLLAAWRVDRARPALDAAYTRGERAVHRALDGLDVVRVPVDRAVVRNLNRPEDLVPITSMPMPPSSADADDQVPRA